LISYVRSKSILNRVKQPDSWFGLWYNMNLYRGCSHRCVYCDSRSECYGIDDFDGEVIVKENAVDLLRDKLPRLRVKGTIGTGSMNDPYQHVEKRLCLTRRALEVIASNGFPVHIITKSDLVLRDMDILKRIGRVYAAVTFTVTTADETMSRKLEPFSTTVSDRFDAMRILSQNGIRTGISLMPVIPFLTDSYDNIQSIVDKASRSGAEYIIASFGLTLRDRQREYYYDRIENMFPGMRTKYRTLFGNSYICRSENTSRLESMFKRKCLERGIATSIPLFDPLDTGQLSFF
jgi:DNA repair photolyase